MMLSEKERRSIRECNLEWHCKEITVFKSVSPDKILFSGYGIIKISENGGLFVDFICSHAASDINFEKPIPENRLITNDRLSMKLVLLNGMSLTSEGFRIQLSPFNRPNNGPIVLRIALFEIVIVSNAIRGESPDQSLYLEFGEEFRIPKNINNKTESTTGFTSWSWNQTRFNLDAFQLDIIRHKKYTSASFSGKEYSLKDAESALKFYLGFSSGVIPQAFYSRTKKDSKVIEKIISINKQLLSRSISAPICHAVHDENNKPLDELHFELFKNIFFQATNNRKIFESIHSQWSRVWYASLSPEIGVLTLTLSVSIEGLLNDIYIKKISELSIDDVFESKKSEINEIINSIESIGKDHKKSIVSFVEKWGNVHPKKALDFLAEHEVITKKQVSAWVKLRHSAAHPRLTVENESTKIKEMSRTIVCLGLFYRLILNVFAYKGAQYAYECLGDISLIQLEYIPILENFGEPYLYHGE